MVTPIRLLLTSASLALLAACAAAPPFEAPAAPPPHAGYAQPDGDGAVRLGEGPEAEWWKAFDSAELDTLVTRALTHNRSLAASLATLRSARERVAAAAGKRLPQIDAQARADYQQVNLSAFGLSDRFGANAIGNPEFDLYALGGGVSYDLDLFGRNRRAVEQAAAEADAQLRQTEAAHLLIAGRTVGQALAIAALNDRIAAQSALIAEDARNVELTEIRRRAGAGTLVDVLSAQSQLAEDRAALPELERQLAEARAMLATLLGQSPAELAATPYRLARFALPADVPVALPSALVRKRPDILEAEARLRAAVAAVGVATADLYPDVTLGASVTQSTSQPGRLFSGRYSAFDLFAGVTAPIFHGGTLRAAKRGAEAEAQASAETYQHVVLEAFQQVSTLLAAIDADRRTYAGRQESAAIAARALHLSRRSFTVGNSGVLQVLDANRAYQRAELALVEARAQQYLNVARLFTATAGGWIPASAPPPGPR